MNEVSSWSNASAWLKYFSEMLLLHMPWFGIVLSETSFQMVSFLINKNETWYIELLSKNARQYLVRNFFTRVVRLEFDRGIKNKTALSKHHWKSGFPFLQKEIVSWFEKRLFTIVLYKWYLTNILFHFLAKTFTNRFHWMLFIGSIIRLTEINRDNKCHPHPRCDEKQFIALVFFIDEDFA